MSQALATEFLCPDQVFDGQSLLTGRALGVVAGKVISLDLVKDVPPGAARHRFGGTIAPGFIDLQVNGGGDVFLNSNPTVNGMAAIAAAHRRFGTVGILPTLITDAPEVLAQAVDAALAARGMSGILGLHIEGPHISVTRRGTHATRFIRPMDTATLAHVTRLRHAGIAVMITVAPESIRLDQVAQLAETGAVVSIGHSDASADDARALIKAGATCFTHLFNAMSPMLNRAPGVTGACINSTAYSGIICDGIHVADEMVAMAIRARPQPDRMFLVSDAMPTVGGADHFMLYGREIRLVDGRLVNSEGSLAGAHVTLADSLARLITVLGVAPDLALRMATSIPAKVIGAPQLGGVLGRSLQDLVRIGPDWRVVSTGIRLGEPVR